MRARFNQLYIFLVLCLIAIPTNILLAQTGPIEYPVERTPDACPDCTHTGEILNPATCSCACQTNFELASGACCDSTKVATNSGTGTKTCCSDSETPVANGSCCPSSQVAGTGASAGCCASTTTVTGDNCCPTSMPTTFTYTSNTSIKNDINTAYGGTVIPGISSYLVSTDATTAKRICEIKGYTTASTIEKSFYGGAQVFNWNTTSNTFSSSLQSGAYIYTKLICSGVKCCPPDQNLSIGLCCSTGTRYSRGICCPTGQHNSGGICCPSGQSKLSGKNECCPTGQISGSTCCPSNKIAVGGNLCCNQGEYNDSGVCRKRCYQTTFTSVVNVDSDHFRYNTTSGTRLQCLEDKITTIYQLLQQFDVDKNAFTITNDFNEVTETGNFYSDGVKWADDHAVKMLWHSLLQPVSGCPSPTLGSLYTACSITFVDDKNNYLSDKNFIDCDNVAADGSWINWHEDNKANGFGGGYNNKTNVACHNGNFVLDESCNLIPQSEILDKCGPGFAGGTTISYYASTPISLIFDNSHDIHSDISFVKIPLNTNSNKNFWLWKGSDKAPLLVYDPKHTGKITSPAQLFGNWTFGGKRLASLFNRDEKFSKTPWENGFKALATLDSNLDNKISGNELSSLALWFDTNRDAISQEGEVKTLDEVGVTALFYNVDKVDSSNNSFEVAKGFERNVNGKSIYGKAIDWSSEGADTQFELLSKHLMGVSKSSSNLNREQTNSIEKDNDSESAKETKQEKSPIAGLWSWGLEDGGSAPNKNGYFILDSHNKEVKGFSLMEVPFAISTEDADKKHSMVRFSRLSGKEELIKGKVELKFKSEIKGGIVENTAELSADGKTMLGKSVASLEINGQNKIVNYNWKATKNK